MTEQEDGLHRFHAARVLAEDRYGFHRRDDDHRVVLDVEPGEVRRLVLTTIVAPE